MNQVTRTFGLVFATGALACSSSQPSPADSAQADSIARARQDSVNRAQPGYVVDSILPVEEELRRFREGLPAVTTLEGGVSSRNELVSAVLTALAKADTAALVGLAVSRAEFAWLVYPESPFTAPPYRQAPGLVWMRQGGESETGLGRLLARYAGLASGRSGTCAEPPVTQGRNRIWRDCTVRLARPGEEITTRPFGTIIERDGRFKVLSYANDL